MFTGLRQSELLGVRWSDIDFAGQRVHVRGQVGRDRVWVEHGKTSAEDAKAYVAALKKVGRYQADVY